MKKLFFCLALVAAATPLPAMNFDDLFAGMGDGAPYGGGDPFGGFGGGDPFGGGDFGDLGDMFGGGGDPFGGGDFGGLGGFGEPAPNAGDKKATKTPDVKTADEAFTTAVGENEKKLPKLFSDGLQDNMATFATKLGTLSAHLSGFALGITTREQLAPHAETVAALSKVVDTIRTQSVYHRAFYDKAFNSVRQRIAKSFTEIDKVVGAFVDVENGEKESLDKPNARLVRRQNRVFEKVKSLMTRTLEPINKDLQKVLDHEKVKQKIEAKKRKYKERAQRFGNNTASHYGGWGNGAAGYFNDGFDMGGFGNSGWHDDGGGWDDMFGGNDWGGGFDSWGGGYNDWGGGYDDYGSGGGWGGSSSSYSSPSSSSSSPSSISSAPAQSAATGVNASNISPDRLKQLDGDYLMPQEQIDPGSEAPPAERLLKLAQQMPKRLATHREKYEKAGVGQKKQEFIRTLLEQKKFTGDVSRLTTIAKLMHDQEVQMSAHQYPALEASVEKYEDELKKCIPLLVDAAKYSSPPFSTLIDEHAIMAKEKVERGKAKAKAAQLKKQRAKSYKALMKWLFVIRKDEHSELHQRLVSALQKQASLVLRKLDALIVANNNDEYISYEETEQLMTLSRQLLQEPIVVGYSVIPDESPEQKEERRSKLAGMVAKKHQVEININIMLAKKRTVLDAMRTTLQEAIAQVKDTVANPATLLTEPSSLAALSRTMDSILKEKYGEQPFYSSVQAVMIPYTDDFFKHLEVQSVLHADLEKLWREQAEQRKQRALERERLRAEAAGEDFEGESDDQVVATGDEPMPEPRVAEPVAVDPVFSADELGMPVGKELSAQPAPIPVEQPVNQEELLDPFANLSNLSPIPEEKGFLDKLKEKVNSSPLLQKAAQGAQSFGTELGQGILQDAKQNARSAVSRATNAAVDRGIRQVAGN